MSEHLYYELACKLLGREPNPAPLPFIYWDYSADKMARNPPTVNIGDLSDRDDEKLAIACGIATGEWPVLNCARRIERMEVALAQPTTPQPTIETEIPLEKEPVEERPRKLLQGWRDICEALDMKYVERNQVKSLNKRFEGPISNEGKGTSPKVYEDDLLGWWNHLAVKQQELSNRREGAKQAAEAQYNYGREGIAAPEIGGGVKKRRSDRT